jgi:hypothetical protein
VAFHVVLQRDAKGASVQGGGSQAGNLEVHTGSRPSNTGRRRIQQRRKPVWSINQPEQGKATTTHSAIQNKPGPQGHPHRHQTETHASGTRSRNKQDKREGVTRRFAMEAPGNPGARTCQAPAARGHTAHQCRGWKGNRPPQQATPRSRAAESRRQGATA